MDKHNLETIFIVATMARAPREMKPGQYHYPKLEKAEEIKSALSQKFNVEGTAIDHEDDAVAHLVKARISYNNVDDLKSAIDKTQSDIAGIVSRIKSDKQKLNVHIKDVYAMELEKDFGISVRSAFLE